MQIRVEPDVLDKTAIQMEEAEKEYHQQISQLYQCIEELGGAWKGKDNMAFVSQINGYREDLHKIAVIMAQYCDFLRNSANAYRNTQESLRSEAGRLQL